MHGQEDVLAQGIPAIVLLFCLCTVPRAQAAATLFVAEPYGYDGTFAGTGHASVYLNRVCASSPVSLRPCAAGEAGIVLSRYRGIAGYDWIAIPFIPYLYAVEKKEDIPLFADKKLIAFLRDRYRRNHLASLIPDLSEGGTPDGDWYELIGASYLRTIYAFEIETSPEQDMKLILLLNDRSNRQRWNLISANCADFVRNILNIYYPHSVHRSIIGDLGVTTPKQLARTFAKYSKRHEELQTSKFVIPQVPGTIPRSKRIRGVLEVMLTSKKYMLPIFMVHPYAAASAVAVYVGYWHFNVGNKAPVLDAKFQLGAAVKPKDLQTVRCQLGVMEGTAFSVAGGTEQRNWPSLEATAEPALDDSEGLVQRVTLGGEVVSVGITRSNILSDPDVAELAASLVKARLGEELKAAAAHKTAWTDVETDLLLFHELVVPQAKPSASAASLTGERSSVVRGHR
jgi:hypothetical protein